MDIHLVDGYSELSDIAAGIVTELVNSKNNAVLGLATGSTPVGMYRKLVETYQQGSVDFSQVITFNLDEYYGLSREHPGSYYYYMYRHFFDHVNISPENINIPEFRDGDITAACRQYDGKIETVGGIDLQVLGIGVNGHIGFNEPDRFLKVHTHLVTLAKKTIEVNSRFFASPEEMPGQAVTMGLGPIMHARKILLLASGSSKAKAVFDMVNGKISTKMPASLLQLHRDVTILADREAASMLEEGSFHISQG